ncbi:hypothetical protein AB0F72_01290 [Actinoplanes sp. NPDC023936]|uniref:hypothetical protein n=1 Tax=Actinoplanes sp. NPDC023936 TaxID=3154910 RepID=UPI0033FEF72C
MAHGAPTYPPVPRSAPMPRTWWWFLIPLLTFGFGTFVMVLVGALKLKSKANLYAAVTYLVATIAFFCTVALTSDPNADPNASPSTASTLLSLGYLVVVWFGGTGHTAVLQHLAGKLDGPPATGPAVVPHTPDSAVAAAARRAARRQEARNLLISNPTMAWELRIGRPDIAGRQYDDGGLVDVNNVPANWLAFALQIPQELADEIVAARSARAGGFSSAEELIVYCDHVTPEMLTMIKDLLVFRPL